MIDGLRLQIGGMRLIWRREAPKCDVCPTDSDRSPELIHLTSFVNRHTKQTGFVRAHGLGVVLGVQRMICLSQVQKSVVSSHPIDVI